MLFMIVTTWEPDKRDKVTQRAIEAEKESFEGVKVIGRWPAIGGCRGFSLIEATDPMAALAASRFWGDLMKLEVVPVIDFEEAMKALKSR